MSSNLPTVELYRLMIPGHTDVLTETIETWLGLAIERHDRPSWGNVYDGAMVLWAAHHIERTPGTGAVTDGSGGGASATGALISQRDGDLSRTYAAPSTSTSSGGGAGASGSFGLTVYGLDYLDLRNSRAATAPTFVGPASTILPGMWIGSWP